MRPSRPLRLTGWLVALLCALRLLAGHGAHAQAPEPAGHVFCGTPTLAGISMLAELVPAEYARALRQLVGAGDDDCRAHCAAAAPLLPPDAPPHGFGRPAPVGLRIAAAAVPAAGRFGPLKPPSTAPPART